MFAHPCMVAERKIQTADCPFARHRWPDSRKAFEYPPISKTRSALHAPRSNKLYIGGFAFRGIRPRCQRSVAKAVPFVSFRPLPHGLRKRSSRAPAGSQAFATPGASLECGSGRLSHLQFYYRFPIVKLYPVLTVSFFFISSFSRKSISENPLLASGPIIIKNLSPDL